MTEAPAGAARARRSFGPVVLLGLVGGVVAAVGGARAWSTGGGDERGDTTAALSSVVAGGGAGEMPVAGALALVALAGWGVLLVTRGRVRRAMAVLAALASAGVLAAVVVGAATVPDAVRTQLAAVGVPPGSVDVGLTAAFWLTGVGGALGLAAAVVAVLAVPAWPEMGRRYDAPAGSAADSGTRGAGGAAPDELELWKSLDRGDDPTDPD